MKKVKFYKREKVGVSIDYGYIFSTIETTKGMHSLIVHKDVRGSWWVSDVDSGCLLHFCGFKSRKDAIEVFQDMEHTVVKRYLNYCDTDAYKQICNETQKEISDYIRSAAKYDYRV